MSNVVTTLCRPLRISASQKAVVMCLADRADDGGTAWPSIPRICEWTCLQRTAVIDAIKVLVGSGMLKVAKGRHNANIYTLDLVAIQAAVNHLIPAEMSGTRTSPAGGLVRQADYLKSGIRTTVVREPDRSSPADGPEASRSVNEAKKGANAPTPPPPAAAAANDNSARLACPHQRIRDLYAERLPGLPQIRKWDSDRERALRTRWADQAKEKGWKTVDEGVEWFGRFFEAVNENDWAMGRGGRGKGHENWECDIDYLLSPKGFRRIIEASGRERQAA